MSKCPECGNELDNSYRYCRKCGFDKEIAAGRPWFVDTEKIKQAFLNLKSEDCIIIEHKEEEVRIMFKCEACGYAETRDDVAKFCPACGAAVEQKETEKLPDWKGLLKDSQAERARMARKFEDLEKENAALAAKVAQLEKDLAEWEIEDDENYGEQMKTENENTRLKEEIAHLRRKGVPWNVRRAIKQMYAHGNFKDCDCCGIFDQPGVGEKSWIRCNECGAEYPPKQIKKMSTPAKPASLRHLRRQLAKRQRTEQKELNHIYDQIWDVWAIQQTRLVFDVFEFNANKGLSLTNLQYGYQLLLSKPQGNAVVENKAVWDDYKEKVIPALEEYLRHQLAGADK